MKVIKGEKQIALVLSKKEFKYLAAALGSSSYNSIEEELKKTRYYGEVEPMPYDMGSGLWQEIEKALK